MDWLEILYRDFQPYSAHVGYKNLTNRVAQCSLQQPSGPKVLVLSLDTSQRIPSPDTGQRLEMSWNETVSASVSPEPWK